MFSVGSLVRCREREWVVLPSPDKDLLLLRPLGGALAETCGIFLPVEGDQVSAASFPPPDPASLGDFEAGALLRDAARLSLRSGAGPFRSLGRLGFRPRPYQLVPLIMALRLDPVRLLIADDVGIGKTIEAGLIARELFDRGEIARLTVLCPPHLCDQWQRELSQKFALEAVVVRSSTAAALERSLPRGDTSVWEHFPFTVASIDYVKSERRRDSFLRAAPELVIIDEAHAAVGARGSAAQQQRYELVRALAAQARRNLILLTATPHSGIEDAFTSLIGLLDPRFAQLDPDRLADPDRDALARHFVQRRRADVQRWLGAGDVTPFPVRESAEVTYTMPRASAYRKLFEEVFTFTKELVQDSGLGTNGRVWRQRARYWAALALLRCVMSSPAAAEKALRMRAAGVEEPEPFVEVDSDGGESEELLRGYVYDPTDQEGAQDQEPGTVVERGSPARERARLARFAARAAELRGKEDPKLQRLIQVAGELLRDGFNPIVYCRYVATADYVAAELARSFDHLPGLRVLAVTGERSEEEREALVAELEASPRRLLVATDCLSEGINLQEGFDAVVHYDLPWNPNRLEQREGRVDRYGQPRATVRTVLLYGQDNPMDEAVMKVLLRKAVRIHRTLGISVPLPLESGTVVETLIATLFQPGVEQLALFDTARQMTLLDAAQGVQEAETAWNRAVEREQASRTRFAQRRIKPEEVARELEESDAVLGDAAAVERFVTAACERLGASLLKDEGRGMKDEGRGVKDEGRGVKDEGRGVKDEGRGVKDEGRGMKDEGRGMKDEGRGMKDEGRRMKDEGRGVKDEGRRMKDEGRRMKDEGRGMKDESGQMTFILGTDVYRLSLGSLPSPVRERLEGIHSSTRASSLIPHPSSLIPHPSSLIPQAPSALERNHPLVVALADYLMETALAPDAHHNNECAPVAARAGVIRTRAVQKRTRLLLLRVRMLIESGRQRVPLLAEELVVAGFSGQPSAPVWLDQPAALALLETARPAANLTADERAIALRAALDDLPALAGELERIAAERAAHLRDAHMRVRAQTGGGSVRVRPAGPPDVLGLYVLLPSLPGV